jgi:hypothetical protein
MMDVEATRLVVDCIDNDGKRRDLTSAASMKRVEKQKTAPSLPMMPLIDSQTADQRRRNQRIARQPSGDLLRQALARPAANCLGTDEDFCSPDQLWGEIECARPRSRARAPACHEAAISGDISGRDFDALAPRTSDAAVFQYKCLKSCCYGSLPGSPSAT